MTSGGFKEHCSYCSARLYRHEALLDLIMVADNDTFRRETLFYFIIIETNTRKSVISLVMNLAVCLIKMTEKSHWWQKDDKLLAAVDTGFILKCRLINLYLSEKSWKFYDVDSGWMRWSHRDNGHIDAVFSYIEYLSAKY